MSLSHAKGNAARDWAALGGVIVVGAASDYRDWNYRDGDERSTAEG
jgi:hypothetical protein